jgi:methylmalonyl-CoA mutase
MNIDDFAPNLSFFFSNGMDAEYAVIAAWRGVSGRGRCAIYNAIRAARCWHTSRLPGVLMHRRSSSRHSHHPAGAVRAVRQLQLLHTNAYGGTDHATEESVRRAVAIQ